ncbi:hypothetical protein [Gryllotalpicola ginsengisoli]|uniref:hypothetical protein n=1 Tax=Gryllotalpicola ginsengisoli TaxID=444608 RepID=UPI0038994B6E
MIRLLWTLSTQARHYLRRYTPTNILLDRIRTRRGLKWGIPAMLLAAPYLLAANYCIDADRGWRPRLAQHPRAAVLLERAQVHYRRASQRRSSPPRASAGRGHRVGGDDLSCAVGRGFGMDV